MSESLTLEIPGNVAGAVRLPDLEKIERLRVELAVSRYSQGVLGLGKAAHFAGLSRWEMGNESLARAAAGAHALRPGGTRRGSPVWP